MSLFAHTHSELVLSAALDVRSSDVLCDGWQEIRVLTFFDAVSSKTLKQRVRAEIGIGYSPTNSYGSVAVWASSTWKPITRLHLKDLPRLNQLALDEKDIYTDAIARLFEIAAKVIT